MCCDSVGLCIKMIILCLKFCHLSLWSLPSMTSDTFVKGVLSAEWGLAVVWQLFRCTGVFL